MTYKRDQDTTDKAFIKKIISHYKKLGRHDLIWRKSITAYKILVSEIMLQQTQVSRVLPKFMLWMKRYPNLEALANATLKDVLILWQGLGYQRRAKALIAIAKKTNKLPRTYDELLLLPGIGPYTASALMAFAYDAWSKPVLETNIRTALIDEFHIGETDIHDGVLYDDLARLENMKDVKKLGARHFYYALMDYGAYLKTIKVSHNKKSKHHVKQSPYEGSFRKLRAHVLFAITNEEELPADERLEEALAQLMKEGFIEKRGKRYAIP